MTTPTSKEHAHKLVERLPADQVATVIRFLEFMLLDPISRSLATAPVDDELLSEEEIQATASSREWFRHNEGIPHEDVLAEFGLRPKDVSPSTEDPEHGRR